MDQWTTAMGQWANQRTLLTLGALVGAGVGLAYAQWQWAIEIAQVQAGIVKYGTHDIPGLILGSLWGLTNQLAGLPLLLGFSERTASAIVSAAMGAVVFEAVAFVVYALSRNAPLAFWTSAVCLVSDATRNGAAYPSLSLATSHTHGFVGLVVPILAVGLLGSGWWRSGALLLGMLPAFHAVTGSFVMVAALLALAMTHPESLRESRSAARYFAAGVALTLLSLIVHMAGAPSLPSIDPAESRRFFLAFVTMWDGHRVPADWLSPAVVLGLASAVIASLKLRGGAGGLSVSTRFVLVFAVIAAALGMLAFALSLLPADAVPAWIVVAMPGRLINVSGFLFVPLVFGLVGQSRRSVFAQVAAMSLGLLITGGPLLGRVWASAPVDKREWVFALIAVFGLAAALKHRVDTGDQQRQPGAALVLPMVAMAALGLTLGGLFFWTTGRVPPGDLWDRSNDAVLSIAAKRPGVLLTGGDLWLIQAQTRRPILLDGGTLDTLPYLPQTAALTQRVLREVYDLDLLAPPYDAHRGGRVPRRTTQATWEAFAPERWRKIATDFGVTDVITESSWMLQLPLIASGPGFRLYTTPRTP